MVEDAEDEYALYDDFADLTEEQFAQIDAAIAPALASTSKTIAHLQVELEEELEETGTITPLSSTSSSEASSSLQKTKPITPLQQFRKSQILSVTDLVSPAWCEVQFDYGLRQQRHRKLQYRPPSFVTEHGKEIVVDQVIAAKSDVIKKKGTTVHKELEREIRPEEIKVKTQTEEERWGLRIINMIDCVDSLLLLGCAREIPVFGFVEGTVVLGVIDEITYSAASPTVQSHEKKRGMQSSPTTPQKTKRIRRSPSPSQSRITSFMSPSKTPIAETPVPDQSSSWNTLSTSFSLHLIDTKTRRKNSLPCEEDTWSSKLQLMLYHRMLAKLMSTQAPFDFSLLWNLLDLDDLLPFSDSFLTQTLLTPESNCLRHLIDLWRLAVSRLNGAKIHSTLQLIYRLQPKQQQKSKRHQNHNDPTRQVTSSREEIEVAKAIEASLQDVQLKMSNQTQLVEALAQSITDPEAGSLVNEQEKISTIDPGLLWALEQSLLTHLHDSGLESSSEFINYSRRCLAELCIAHNEGSSSKDVDCDIATQYQTKQTHHSDIIGTKEFEYNSQALDEYLLDVMKWWNGERKPRGVSLEQSGRCFSCEYRTGCEWREEKAREIEDGLALRKKVAN
ncbi:exonuclease V [Lentinula raphanica]|nr:exonuclease V [Lentinula raphanica]